MFWSICLEAFSSYEIFVLKTYVYDRGMQFEKKKLFNVYHVIFVLLQVIYPHHSKLTEKEVLTVYLCVILLVSSMG